MKRRDAKDDFSSLNDKKRFIGAAEELGMRRSEFMVYLEKLVRKLEQVIEALCLLGYVKDENRVFNEVNALIATLLNSRYMIEHYDSKLISVIQEVLNCTREIFQDSDIDYEEQLQDNEEGNLDEHLCSNAKKWEEIYGLENIKEALIETFCYPIELPHLFKSSKALQKTCHSVLLYGPPGTGKSMIVYSLAEYLKRVYKLEMSFYQISSSDILSKWTGESEKNIKKVFKIAKSNSPSILFFDEIDSIGLQREQENDSTSTRILLEFLIQMNHVTSNDNVFIIAATNQLEMLDKACLRRFHKRLQVNLPDQKARKLILMNNLDDSELSEGDFDAVSTDLENFSGSDLEDLCREVSMRPIKELIEHRKLSGFSNLTDRQRKVNISDFQEVLKYFKASSTTYDP